MKEKRQISNKEAKRANVDLIEESQLSHSRKTNWQRIKRRTRNRKTIGESCLEKYPNATKRKGRRITRHPVALISIQILLTIKITTNMVTVNMTGGCALPQRSSLWH